MAMKLKATSSGLAAGIFTTLQNKTNIVCNMYSAIKHFFIYSIVLIYFFIYLYFAKKIIILPVIISMERNIIPTSSLWTWN